MTSRIGLNIIGRTSKLVETLRRVRPVATLVMDDLVLAHELTHALPNSIIIFRDWSLGDHRHLTLAPQRQIDRALAQHNGQPNLWFYTTNEAGLTPEIFDWHLKLLDSPEHLRWVGLNPSVGTTPQSPYGWMYAEPFLRAIVPHRERFIFGIHEYAGAVPNSGMPEFTRHLQEWDGERLPAYHCGRFCYLEQFCAAKSIPVPRIILTEHGFDDLSDIQLWLKTLRVTAGYANLRGWKSLTEQWYAWYRGKGWSPQRTLFEALNWMDRSLYRGTAVEAQLIFCWGTNGDPAWAQFDVSDADEFIHLWQQDAEHPPLPPARVNPEPPLIPGMDYTLDIPASYVNLREQPSITGRILARVDRNDVVTGLAEEWTGGNECWRKVRLKSGQEGWVSLQWSLAQGFRVSFIPLVIGPSPIIEGLVSTSSVWTPIRLKPAADSPQLGVIYPDQEFETTWTEVGDDVQGRWLQVRLPEGEFGWARLNDLHYLTK